LAATVSNVTSTSRDPLKC